MAQFRISDFEDITPSQAIQMQNELREELELSPPDHEIRTLGGADLSFDRGSDMVHAGVVVLDLATLKPLAQSLVTATVSFPYIPGLLAFRELPALMEAWRQCRLKPDVLILDGHGLAHPRRMGIASHFGILADHPTVGCAKNLLTGEFDEPADEKGSHTPIRESGETIGLVVRSRTGVKPIFVSPGHKTDFDSARRIVQQALTRYKLPETTRWAHRLVNELRSGERGEGYMEFDDGAGDGGR